MRHGSTIAVIIPAYNEEPSIGKVVSAIPDWVDDIIVADNGSTDTTAEVARVAGARVVSELRRGYGSACLAGMAALGDPDIVVFLDGDFSDYPGEMDLLVDPIARNEVDMVIGSRTIGQREKGALTPQALFGNWLACTLIRWFWSVSFTDLGPFRAIRHEALTCLSMCDRNYGWTVEMQIKAARNRVRIRETPVSYRRRIGKSKVSGTVKGVVGAGAKILYTIFLAAINRLPGDRRPGTAERIIVFTRYPKPGETKTRMIPALGPEGAAALQQLMTEHAIGRIRGLAGCRSISIEVRYDGAGKHLVSNWLGPHLSYRQQDGGDIGVRMERAFAEAFQEGAEKAVLVGTDCPGITAELLRGAFDALSENDVVFGPAKDGGYYLVGLKRPVSEIFSGMPWGTREVLQRTMQVVDRLGLSAALLESLDDVDRPEDLPVWRREVRDSPTYFPAPTISVIIPAFNEASTVSRAIESARNDPDVQVIVVDGGSDDGTVEVARDGKAEVIVSVPERAKQMNAGAAAATGDMLLFLHADTTLPGGFGDLARQALARPGTVAGAFELEIDASKSGLRIVERMVNWRSRRMQMPYGDQALFLKAEFFREMGGFPEIAIMEDFEFVRRLCRQGRITIASASIATSPRRWLELGTVRTTLINQAVIFAYFMGVSPSSIARWYHGRRERP